jgi:hypothetical protein
LAVCREDHLIKQWAYYQNFKDSEPKFLKPWNNYQKQVTFTFFDRPNENVGPKNVIARILIYLYLPPCKKSPDFIDYKKEPVHMSWFFLLKTSNIDCFGRNYNKCIYVIFKIVLE